MKIEAKHRLAADVHQGIIPRLMSWIQEVLHAKFEKSDGNTYHMHTKANAEEAIRRYMSIEDLMGRSGAKAETPKLEPHGVTFEFDLSAGDGTPQAGQGETKLAVTFTQDGLYVAVRIASQGIPVQQPAQQPNQQQGEEGQQRPPHQNGQPQQGLPNNGQPQEQQRQAEQQEKRMIEDQQRQAKRYESEGV